jgi:hypothetical protein
MAGWLRAESMTPPDMQALVALVREAFSSVILEDGIGLREAQGIDDYADEQTCAAYRASDEKLDWSRIPIDELNACYSSLSFFDAKGMRFHLPAFLIAELSGEYHQDMSLQLAYLNDYSIAQYGLLSPAQRAAVRAYLQFILRDPRYGFSHPQVRRALDEYWTDRI